MPRSASPSTRNNGAKKSVVPPPPPPVLLRINTTEELEAQLIAHAGAAVVVVVSPLTPSTTDAVVAALEHLNSNRPPLLADVAIGVLYALPATTAVCHALGVSALPFVRSYSYGTVVGEFAGDNIEKIELLAKVAATAAVAERERLQQAEAEAAAAAAAAAAEDGQLTAAA